jgi:microcystin-dependent protein
MNETIKTILIALIVVWLYNNYGKEGFDYRYNNPSLDGYNNMVLTDPNGNLASIPFPKGMIMIWTQNNIPSGWALCDGNNGTPNLSGKFLLGVNPDPNAAANFRTPGMGGGSAKISVGQLPAHNHDIVGKGDDTGFCASGECGFYSTDRWSNDREVRASTSGGKLVVENTGSGQDYYPPFVTVAYIMKL